MSQYMLQNQIAKSKGNTSGILRDYSGAPIFYESNPSIALEKQNNTGFSPLSGTPGSSTQCLIFFNNGNTLQVEKESYIQFDVTTTDGTNDATFLRGAIDFIQYLEIQINNSNDTILYDASPYSSKNIALRHALSEYLKTHQKADHTAQTIMADWRSELTTYNGTQVTNAGTTRYYLPLAPFITFWSNLPVNATYKNSAGQNVQLISQMLIKLQFMPSVTNANDHANICVSNTNANAYNQVTFNNINFMRSYKEVYDQSTYIIPVMSQVRFNVPRVTSKYYNQAWVYNSSPSITFRLSDIASQAYIQKLYVFAMTHQTTFNAADAGVKYSGYNYFRWSKACMFNSQELLDFTPILATADANNRLRSFEMRQHKNQYTNDLPITCYNTGDPLSQQYLELTEIMFDDIQVHETHSDVVETTATNRNQDYTITLIPGAQANISNADIYVCVVYYDRFQWNPDGTMRKLTVDTL